MAFALPARKWAPPARVQAAGAPLSGAISGYASLFGKIDLSGDAVERGAFARSLQRRGVRGIRMLFQHDPAEPIGAWLDIVEDGKGLFARGALNLQVARAREVAALLAQGAIDGLSIGFRTVRAQKSAGVRRLAEIDLWEISVVTFPMLPDARVGLRMPAGKSVCPGPATASAGAPIRDPAQCAAKRPFLVR